MKEWVVSGKLGDFSWRPLIIEEQYILISMLRSHSCKMEKKSTDFKASDFSSNPVTIIW